MLPVTLSGNSGYQCSRPSTSVDSQLQVENSVDKFLESQKLCVEFPLCWGLRPPTPDVVQV